VGGGGTPLSKRLQETKKRAGIRGKRPVEDEKELSELKAIREKEKRNATRIIAELY